VDALLLAALGFGDPNYIRWADVSVAADTVSGDGLECRRYLLHDLRRGLNGAKRGIERLRQLDLVPITRDHAVELCRTGHPGAIDADRDHDLEVTGAVNTDKHAPFTNDFDAVLA
jgi:hypothetical protein